MGLLLHGYISFTFEPIHKSQDSPKTPKLQSLILLKPEKQQTPEDPKLHSEESWRNLRNLTPVPPRKTGKKPVAAVTEPLNPKAHSL